MSEDEEDKERPTAVVIIKSCMECPRRSVYGMTPLCLENGSTLSSMEIPLWCPKLNDSDKMMRDIIKEGNIASLGLHTQSEFDEAFDSGVISVTDNPREYSLYTGTEIDEAKEEAKEIAFDEGLEEGETKVMENPGDYELFSKSELDDAVAEAIDEIMSNPREHGLRRIDDE